MMNSPQPKGIIVKPAKIIAVLTWLVTISLVTAAWLGFEKLLPLLPSDILEYAGYLQYFVLLIIFLVGLYKGLLWLTISYTIDDAQLVYKRGVFTISTDYLELFRVKDISKKQPFHFILLGLMELQLNTSDKSHSLLRVRAIPKSNLAAVLRDAVQKSRIKNRVYEVD